jgi:phosphatidylglycerophosphatase C
MNIKAWTEEPNPPPSESPSDGQTILTQIRRRREGYYRPLVAFDFDGTLTARDSFLAFLRWRFGARTYAARMASLAPAGLKWLTDRRRDRLKSAVIKTFLGGLAAEEIAADSRRFAAQQSTRLIRPDALACWKRWQGGGARLVIVTASPELTVGPFAHGLGADLLLGTRLETDSAGRLTGLLVGANCRGPEKVHRLREAFGEDVALAAAYGDSDGDREMLKLADEPCLKIFGARR